MMFNRSACFLVALLTACNSCGQDLVVDVWLDSDGIDQPSDNLDQFTESRDQPDWIDASDISTDVLDAEPVRDGLLDPADVYCEPFAADCVMLDYLARDAGTTSMIPVAHAKTPIYCASSCRQVSFSEDGIWNSSYDVWDNYLVFNTSSGDVNPVTRIYLVDLTTLDHFIIDERDMSLDGAPAIGFASIYESEVLFLRSIDTSTGEYNIQILKYSIETGVNQILFQRVYAMGSSAIYRPEIFNTYLSWKDHRNYPFYSNIYTLDLLNRKECSISKDIGSQVGGIWENWVVFSQGSGGLGVQIYAHSLSDNLTRQVTSGPGDKFGPSVWEDRIVWTDMRNGGTMMDQVNADVFMMDLSSGVETPICTNPASQPTYADIYGDKIVWPDCRHDAMHPTEPTLATNTEIYMYDITTGTETRLTMSPYAIKTRPKIFGNRVYFLMKDTEGEDSVFEIDLDL